jgi:hypothetical protein
MITDTSGDMPLKQQLDILWARFDTNGDGIINWRVKSSTAIFVPKIYTTNASPFTLNPKP